MSHHVTCHVTTMSYASLLSIKEKKTQKKRNIKSRKIDKRKRKILVSKAFYNKEMKRYAERKEMEKWKKEDKVMLSTKNLVFKKRLVCKLVERYIGLYEIKEVVSTNVVKLRLLSSMKIHLVVNVS